MDSIRLNKYLSKLGIAARRKVDEMVENGQVTVNGEQAELGQQIYPEIDIIEINGKKIDNKEEKKVYYMLNKPKKVLCAVTDASNRRLVVDCINTDKKIFPIGRLDYDTEGLIIITNDGEIFNKVIHPKSEIYKSYIAIVCGKISRESINILKNGVLLKDGKTLPAKVKILYQDTNSTKVKIDIREGKNRQVRRMFDKIGHRVKYLKRVSIGDIELGELIPGEYRELTNAELNYIKNL